MGIGWECNLKEKEWDGNRMGAYGKRRMGAYGKRMGM